MRSFGCTHDICVGLGYSAGASSRGRDGLVSVSPSQHLHPRDSSRLCFVASCALDGDSVACRWLNDGRWRKGGADGRRNSTDGPQMPGCLLRRATATNCAHVTGSGYPHHVQLMWILRHPRHGTAGCGHSPFGVLVELQLRFL